MHFEGGEQSHNGVKIPVDHRVLVIDNDKIALETSISALRHDLNYVSGVDNAEIAIKFLTSLRYDVIITKVMMPGKSGVELCQSLKEIANGARIVALCDGTWLGIEEEKTLAKEQLGAQTVLVHPYNIAALLKSL